MGDDAAGQPWESQTDPSGVYTSQLPGLPFHGELGGEVAATLSALATGRISISDLDDPRYRLSAEGTPTAIIDHDDFVAIRDAAF